MYVGLIPAGLVLAIPPSYAGALNHYVIADNFTLSEPVSLRNLVVNEGKGEYVPGKRIMAWLWLEIGLRWKRLGFGFVQRYECNGRFSEDTAEIIGLTVNKLDLPTGREFDIWFEGLAFHSKGVRLSYELSPVPWLSLTAGVSYLYSDMYMEGNLKGTATVLSDKDYDYEADVDYCYTEDVLFDRKVSAPSGQGFTVDLLTRLSFGSSWTVELAVTDLLGRIYWENLPRTDALATSDRKEYDENGYVQIDPVLTGYEGYYHTYTQELSPRGRMRLSYGFRNHTALVDGYRQYDLTLWAVGHRYRLRAGSTLLKYWPENHAVTLGFSGTYLSFEITADHVDLDKVHMVAFTLSVQS